MIACIRRWLRLHRDAHPAPQPSEFVARMRTARRMGLAEKQASQRAVRRIDAHGLRDRITVPNEGGR